MVCTRTGSLPGGGTRQMSAVQGVGRSQPGDGGKSWSPAPLQVPALGALVHGEQYVGTHPGVHTWSRNNVSQRLHWQEPAHTVPGRGWGLCWAPEGCSEEHAEARAAQDSGQETASTIKQRT